MFGRFHSLRVCVTRDVSLQTEADRKSCGLTVLGFVLASFKGTMQSLLGLVRGVLLNRSRAAQQRYRIKQKDRLAYAESRVAELEEQLRVMQLRQETVQAQPPLPAPLLAPTADAPAVVAANRQPAAPAEAPAEELAARTLGTALW